MKSTLLKSLLGAAGVLALATGAQAETLRILTWGGYVPQEVIDQFKAETGIDVEVTTSNNEEMISKLRATGGAGFDLAQPSQDRITGPQQEFGIYKPLDLSKIDQGQFIASMLEATKANTTLDGQVYGLPHIWGTDGLVVNTTTADGVRDYDDLCADEYAGRVSYRLKRPTLMAFAFASGKDPFALYNDPAAYEALMNEVGETLIACKDNVRFYWDDGAQIQQALLGGEVDAAMAWDTGGWKLNRENPDIVFRAPESGAMGWIDTFAIPAKGQNDEAAYQWINFNMRPEIAAKVTESAGNFTAAKGADALVTGPIKDQFAASFPPEAIDNINWYPAVPAGLEEIEGKVLDRVKAAQ